MTLVSTRYGIVGLSINGRLEMQLAPDCFQPIPGVRVYSVAEVNELDTKAHRLGNLVELWAEQERRRQAQ